MSTSSKNNFENLFSIATAFCVFIIIGTFFTLSKQYPPRFFMLERQKAETKVEGYKRPGTVSPDAAQGQSKRKMIDLLAGLTEQQKQLVQLTIPPV